MNIVTVKLRTALLSMGIFLALMSLTGLAFRYARSVSLAESPLRPICRVAREDGKIALTFDVSGGGEAISGVLASLGDVKATFFLSGDFVRNHPEDVRRLFDAGHQLEVASDSLQDIPMEELSYRLRQTGDAIFHLTAHRPTLCRIPYGSYHKGVLSAILESGHRPVQWSLDSRDWRNPSPHVLIASVTKQVTSGEILLFHAENPSTQTALPEILYRLRQKGMEAVPLSELLYPDSDIVTGDGTQMPNPKENGEAVS